MKMFQIVRIKCVLLSMKINKMSPAIPAIVYNTSTRFPSFRNSAGNPRCFIFQHNNPHCKCLMQRITPGKRRKLLHPWNHNPETSAYTSHSRESVEWKNKNPIRSGFCCAENKNCYFHSSVCINSMCDNSREPLLTVKIKLYSTFQRCRARIVLCSCYCLSCNTRCNLRPRRSMDSCCHIVLPLFSLLYFLWMKSFYTTLGVFVNTSF